MASALAANSFAISSTTMWTAVSDSTCATLARARTASRTAPAHSPETGALRVSLRLRSSSLQSPCKWLMFVWKDQGERSTLSPDVPLGDSLELFMRRQDAERL